MKEGWVHKKLGEVITLNYGKPLPEPHRNPDGNYPVYGANGAIDRSDKFFSDRPSIIVGRKGSAGELNLTESKFWPLDVTYFVTFDVHYYDLRFIYYLLSSLDLPKMAKGVKPGINRNEVYSLDTYIPPLPEQQRIVAILDQAFAAIAKAKENAEKNLKNTREVFESYLNSVFANPGIKWEMRKLGDLCDTGAGGTPLKSHIEYYDNGTIPWLMSGEVNQGEIFESKYFISELGLKNSSARLFPKNTVVIAMYGATAGQVGILRFESSTNQAVCGILPNVKYLPEFIYYYFLFKKNDLIAQAVGNAQPNISQIKIKETLLPIITIAKQESIVSVFNRLSNSTHRFEAIYKEKLSNLVELKKSILQKAFNGDLNTDVS